MILILNCGSQSIKWKLFDNNLKVKKEGKREFFSGFNGFRKILKEELREITIFKKDIKLIGHRVVHGGEGFKKPAKISPKNLKGLEKFNELAPLHNPFNTLGIKESQKFFPNIPNFAVFDTEFYADLSEKVYTYPLPENLRRKYRFKRFGFHGISHEYAANEAAKKIGKQFKKLKIITCHLGGGCSITAIKNGRAIDTSMGFTPLEGLMMMTRPGSIDPGIILKLAKDFSGKKLDDIFNYNSGVRGICGTGEMLEVLKDVKKGNKKAKLALDMFVYSIQKHIGACFAILGGCDLLVFTGMIGFGSAKIRDMICNLDIFKSVKILAVKTDEELAVAKKIKNIML